MEQFSNDAQAIASSGDPSDGLMGGIHAGDSPDLIVRKFILKQDAVEATFGQARAIETTLQALLSIAWSLSDIPGRKSLVWATGDLRFYLDSFAFRDVDLVGVGIHRQRQRFGSSWDCRRVVCCPINDC